MQVVVVVIGFIAEPSAIKIGIGEESSTVGMLRFDIVLG
jgi:hypothetical protein